MGQIGPDITFDELKKLYLDALGLLNQKATENATLSIRAEAAEADLAEWKDKADAEIAALVARVAELDKLENVWRAETEHRRKAVIDGLLEKINKLSALADATATTRAETAEAEVKRYMDESQSLRAALEVLFIEKDEIDPRDIRLLLDRIPTCETIPYWKVKNALADIEERLKQLREGIEQECYDYEAAPGDILIDVARRLRGILKQCADRAEKASEQ